MRRYFNITSRWILGLWLVVFALPAGCQAPAAEGQNPVANIIIKLWPQNEQQKRQELIDKLSSSDADLRREGVEDLGKGVPASWKVTPKMLSIMAQGDPDELVRATALRVLAKIDEQQEYLPKVMETTVKDRSGQVRLESVKILATHNDDNSLSNLVVMLSEDSDTQVKIAAAEALGNYQDQRAIRSLIAALDSKEFALCFRARQSLTALTGKDLGYNSQAWLDWLNQINP